MQSPDFWKDHKRAGQLSKELNELKEEVSFWDNFDKQLQDYLEQSDEELAVKESEIRQFKSSFDRQYVKAFLSGKYDRGNALLYIYSGAGGVDAQDWASMLLRMYQKYAENHGWGFTILDQSFGEQGGIKSPVVEIIKKR